MLDPLGLSSTFLTFLLLTLSLQFSLLSGNRPLSFSCTCSINYFSPITIILIFKSFFLIIRLSLSWISCFCLGDNIVASAGEEINGFQAFFSALLCCLWALCFFLLCFLCFCFCLPLMGAFRRYMGIVCSSCIHNREALRSCLSTGASRDNTWQLVGLSERWLRRDHTIHWGKTPTVVLRDLFWGGDER